MHYFQKFIDSRKTFSATPSLAGLSVLLLAVASANAQSPPVESNSPRPAAIPANAGASQPSPIPPPLRFPGAALFNPNPPFLTGVVTDRKDGRYLEGQKLRVQFMAERDAYLYVIYYQADGRSLLLFPNAIERANRVAAGKPLVVPASEKDLRMRIQAPYGAEVLQVLATIDPVQELNELVGSTNGFPSVSSD